MLHALYLSSSYLGFLKEDFLSFTIYKLGNAMTPRAGQILTPGQLFEH
jgi:hypothetical protein